MENKLIKLDSFKLLTEINVLNTYPDFFKDNWNSINDATGEVIEDTYKNNTFFHDDGIFCKFKAVRKKIFNKTYIEITYTSKMLFDDYLRGINKSNFKKCYEFVQTILNFDCNYDDYIKNSYIYDIDICQDFRSSDLVFDRLLRKLKSISNFSMSLYSIENSTKVSKNLNNSFMVGAQISKRSESYGQKNKPIFLKLYSKGSEMKDNKYQFIGYDDLHDLRRMEFTLKNRNSIISHFKHVNKYQLYENVKDNLVSFFLDNKDSERNNFLNAISNFIHLKSFSSIPDYEKATTFNEKEENNNKFIFQELSKLTPSKLMILDLLCKSDQYGNDLKDFGINPKFLSSFGISDTSISRLKSDLKKNYLLYKKYLETNTFKNENFKL